MDCRRRTVELVECARTGASPGAALGRHLAECAICSRRWEDERGLTGQLRAVRAAAAAWSLPETKREQAAREFARMRSPRPALALKWALSAAAVLLMTVAISLVWQHAGQGPDVAAPAVSDEQENQFVAVPYAPPLAEGEFVRVVRTELHPVALARMGIDVDAAGRTEIPAEVLLGEDEFPRAVRISEDAQF